MNCTIDNCAKPTVARGMCHKHYKRWQTNGHPGLNTGKGCTDPVERFKFLTKRMPNGCLEWQGPIAPNGYGQTKWNRAYFSAHKFSWTLHRGNVQDGMLVLHKCDNKRCVDPEHLYIGTGQQNSADAIARGQIKTGTQHALSKLTDAQIAEARNSAESIKGMAAKFGVHWATLYKALSRRRA